MGKNLKGKNIGRGICQRKDGIYQAKIYLKMTPKPIYLYDSNLNSLRVKKKRFEQQKLNNFFTTQSLLTVNDWFDHWMEIVCAVKLKNTTIQNYYNNYNRIKGSIQNIKLIELTQSHIQMAINEISKKYKPSTVKSSLNALSTCLEYAEKNMIIANNPCKCIVISNYTDRSFVPIEQEDEMKYITKDMLDLFFEAAKNCRSRYYFYILLDTGLRAGELCALQWKDVDFDKKELHVYKTINKTRCYFDIHGEKLEKSIASVQITTPKRNASNRIVPLTDGVIEAFLKLKEI
ncbi:tyrosine-type recombinase/integrase [Faecalimonas umbilicata]|uniref:tyrosine-type recombinase/integrase n=1 Tax=Faecalimonas umbilicata TaxID=1912855 RepID=UPI0022DFE943|nr:site-specific integrase [Faecalimonas umbilicata]